MIPEKIQIKIFTESPAGAGLADFIPVFHAWIKHGKLGELLVDVANYAHVPDGPGVGIVGHGSDYFMDTAGRRLGLLYSRKRQGPAAPAERLDDAFRRAIRAALLLEADPALAGKVRFKTDEFLLRVNDRLAAPNNDGTLAALRPDIDAFAARLFGAPAAIEKVGEGRELFSVRLRPAGRPTLAGLLERLGGPATA